MDTILLVLNLVGALVSGFVAGWIFMDRQYVGAALLMGLSWLNWAGFFLAIQ